MNKITIENKKLSELIPAEYNPRIISEDAMNGLKKSIKTFGYIEPIVWNKRTSRVVSGHQRLTVLKEDGEENVDVVVIDITEEEEKALNVTLNNKEIQGDWDFEKLEIVLQEIKVNLPEFEELRLDVLEDMSFVDTSIPDDNKDIDEDKLKQTKNCCPSCGFEW